MDSTLSHSLSNLSLGSGRLRCYVLMDIREAGVALPRAGSKHELYGSGGPIPTVDRLHSGFGASGKPAQSWLRVQLL